MARVRLTAGRIRDFSAGESDQAFLWDADTPQLAVRATAGAKAFIFQSRLGGRSLRVTIGSVDAWGIDQARAEARRLQTLVDQGRDPRVARAEQLRADQEKQTELKRVTAQVGEAWEAYIADRSPQWGERHLANHTALADPGGKVRTRGRRPGESKTTMPGPLYPLMQLRLVDLNHDAVRVWLSRQIERGPTQAHQAYRALRAFVTWAADQKEYAGVVHADACTRDAIRRLLPKQAAKTDCLQREQLPVWFAAVGRIGNPVIAAYLQVLLLTGARREELATVKWSDVDFRWHSITMRDKVEGIRTIPLTPYVESLLLELKRIADTPPPRFRILHGRKIENDLSAWKPSPWVFASKAAASGRLTDPSAAHDQACTGAGIPGLTLHGLRRSFKSLSEWVEIPVGVVAQIMGHRPSATAEKHYTVRSIDLLRMWHVRIEMWMLSQAKVEFKYPDQQQAVEQAA